MKKYLLSAVLLLAVISVNVPAKASVNISVNLSAYYGVPQPVIVGYYNQTGRSWANVSTVLYLSRRARVSPAVIISLHRRGLSFVAIANQYDIPPGRYYAPVTATVVYIQPMPGYYWGSDRHYHHDNGLHRGWYKGDHGHGPRGGDHGKGNHGDRNNHHNHGDH